MKQAAVFFLGALAFALSSSGAGRAAEIEVPLPALSGAYGGCQAISRASEFRFATLPINIRGVSIRLQGFTDPGRWSCDWTPITEARRIEFIATMPDSVTMGTWRVDTIIGEWFDEFPFAFDVTVPLVPQNGATLGFLGTGHGSLTLRGFPEPVQGGGLSCVITCAAASLYIVSLVIDTDYAIGTQSSTWGEIKALYSK